MEVLGLFEIDTEKKTVTYSNVKDPSLIPKSEEYKVIIKE